MISIKSWDSDWALEYREEGDRNMGELRFLPTYDRQDAAVYK